MAIVLPEKGYFIGYKGWDDNSLYAFNPTTGEVTGTVSSLLNRNIAVEDSVDNWGRLWVADRSRGGIALIDPDTDEEVEFIDTGLPPLCASFCIQ
jgi:hypothetical protein